MSAVILAVGFGLVTASVLAVSALGFNLDVAVSGVLNIGFIAFMLIGQFAALVVSENGGGLLWGGVAACGTGAIAGYVLYEGVLVWFKRRGARPFILVLVTFAISTIVISAATMGFGTGQFSYAISAGLKSAVHPFGMTLTTAQGIVILLSAVIVVLVDVALRYTSLGRDVRAISDDEGLAMAHGVKVRRVTDLVWAVSGALGGLAGMLLALNEVTFSTVTDQVYFVLIIAAGFLGGPGKPYGAAVGALLVGLADAIAGVWVSPQLTPLIAFGLLIAVILFRPLGVLGASKGEVRA